MNPVPLRRLVQVFEGPHPPSKDGTSTFTWRAPSGLGGDEREYHFETVDGVYVPRPLVGDFYVQEPHRWCCWTNCDGKHVVVLLPSAKDGSGDGHEWSPSNRANNCTKKDDTLHRCWVLHGDVDRPETLHVDKDGVTCTAGGGSIQFGDFHGYVSSGFVSERHERRRGKVAVAAAQAPPRTPRPAPIRIGPARGTATRVVASPAEHPTRRDHPVIPPRAKR
jgi:hypothetical protein